MSEDFVTKPHHVGCAVKDLKACQATYANGLGIRRRTCPIDVKSQNVTVCFLELADRFYLELVTPFGNNPKLERFLKVGFYHLCSLVDDLDFAENHLKSQGFFPLPSFQSEAFAGGRCQFFLSPQEQLIELAEMSSANFDQFFLSKLDT